MESEFIKELAGMADWPLLGYAPGERTCRCNVCGVHFDGDKRSTVCLRCAVDLATTKARTCGVQKDKIERLEQANVAWGEVHQKVILQRADLFRENERLRETLKTGISLVLDLADVVVKNHPDLKAALQKAKGDFERSMRVEKALDEQAAARFPAAGDKVKFLNRGGYPNELREAQLTFDTHTLYPVEACEVRNFDHRIKIKGLDGWWNGVMFEVVK